MRGKGWIRDILSHFIILLLLGAGLLALSKKAGEIPALAALDYLDKALTAAFVLYGLMVLIFIFQLFSSAKLERFSPGNPDSLARLDRMRRFKLPGGYSKLQETLPDFRSYFRSSFIGPGWKRSAAQPFDAVFVRKRKLPTFGRTPYVDRVFIFYHPMLNVLIVDQILKECERHITEFYRFYPAVRNTVLFVTDMKNRDEVTSAGAGAVNYLCNPGRRISLYPLLLDMESGRFFYPLDTTLLSRRRRFYHWIQKLLFRRRIKEAFRPKSQKQS